MPGTALNSWLPPAMPMFTGTERLSNWGKITELVSGQSWDLNPDSWVQDLKLCLAWALHILKRERAANISSAPTVRLGGVFPPSFHRHGYYHCRHHFTDGEAEAQRIYHGTRTRSCNDSMTNYGSEYKSVSSQISAHNSTSINAEPLPSSESRSLSWTHVCPS